MKTILVLAMLFLAGCLDYAYTRGYSHTTECWRVEQRDNTRTNFCTVCQNGKCRVEKQKQIYVN